MFYTAVLLALQCRLRTRSRQGPGAAIARPTLLVLMVTFIQVVTGVGHAREIVTLTGDPWPPYVIGQLGEEAQAGIAVELVRVIFDRFPETDVSFPMIPWNRALKEVERGSKDGIVLLLKTPERERYMEYTDPLFTAHNLVWYSTRRFAAGFDWSSLADLGSHTVGVIRGYSYGDEIDRAIESGELRVSLAPTVDQLFAMLARDRIELALAGDAVGYALARKHSRTAEIVAAEKATGTDVYHLAFSRKSPARRLIPEINSIIAELREQGLVDRLISGAAEPVEPGSN